MIFADHRDVTGPKPRRSGVRAGLALVCLGVALGGAALLARRCLLYVTVHGNSMAPGLRHGDGVLALRCPPAAIRRGQIVVGLTPDDHLDSEALAAGVPPYFVKRVVGVAGDRVQQPDGTLLTVPESSYYVRGEVEYSVDSGVWGPVDDSRLIGVVVRRLSRRTSN